MLATTFDRQVLTSRTLLPALWIATLAAQSCASDDRTGAPDVAVQAAPIVLGTVAPDAQFPWIVRLSGNLSCQGVLLEPRWVLTAAHCIDPVIGGVTVSYQRTDPVTGRMTTGSQVASPSAVFLHPEWSLATLSNDIGLIKLPAPLDSEPDPLLQPADLALSDVAGETGIVASMIHHREALPPGSVAVLHAVPDIGPTKLTARSSEGSLCQGDSGSGFIANRAGRNVVIGIASASASGSDCASRANVEFDATKVSAYISWIQSHIGAQTQYRLIARSTRDGAPAAVGTPSGIVFPALGVTNVVYRDSNSQIRELWQQGSDHGTSDLTGLAGSIAAAGDPTSYIAPDGFEVALYRGTNGHVYSLYWNTGPVGSDALSVVAGAPQAAGNPVGYVGTDGWTHVIYRTSDGSLEELYWIGAGAPGAGSLTRAAGAPKASGDPAPYINTVNGQNIVAYRGTDGHIHTVYWFTGDVGHDDLSGVAGSPASAGDPFAYYRANDDSHQIAYRGVDGHIYELWWNGAAAVQALDLTAAAGASAADSDPVGYYRAGANTKHVFYRSQDGHLHEISWVPGGSAFNHVDVSVEAPAGLAVGKPAAFTVEGANTQHLIYRGADNGIYEIRW